MPAKKKRLKKLVDAVSSILGDTTKAKKLKKAEALEGFIGKLEKKHREMLAELSSGAVTGKAAKEESRRAESLGRQIKKAKKLLADMK